MPCVSLNNCVGSVLATEKIWSVRLKGVAARGSYSAQFKLKTHHAIKLDYSIVFATNGARAILSQPPECNTEN